MQQETIKPLLEKVAVRARTTSEIEAYVQAKKKSAAQISPAYSQLWNAIENLSLAGGKRLRGYMVYLAYATSLQKSHEEEQWAYAAAAVELLHLALLIHDDIIDRDTIRYGIKNVSGQQFDYYKPVIDSPQEAQHFADSAAILAGDLLINGAFEMLAKATQNPTKQSAAREYMHEAIFRVAGGELLDTESAFSESPASSMMIAEEKTASYSFSSPLLIGASLGGADEQTHQVFRDFGKALGIAYQLQDDILGMFGDESKTGKSTYGDLREGKRTYLVECFFAQASDAQQETFIRAFGNQTATRAEQQAAKQALIDSGARRAVEEMIAELVHNAEQAIAALHTSDDHSKAYRNLIDICVNRDK